MQLSETTKNATFTERGCKDRMKPLVNAFKKETMASLKASGTEEEYSEMFCNPIYAYILYLVQFPLYCFKHIVCLDEMQITMLKYTRFL